MDITPKLTDKIGRRVKDFIIGRMMDLEEDGFTSEDTIFNPSKTALNEAGKSPWSKYFNLEQMTLSECESMIMFRFCSKISKR